METNVTKIHLSHNDVAFHPLSYGDRNGRLFYWKDELYRAVSVRNASLYLELFSKGIVQSLVDKKMLIPTQIASLELDNYALVLQHQKLPFVSYAYEWGAAMLKDAALLLIALNLELAPYGLCLQDAHPWNILFNGTTPYYVDFGSIAPVETIKPFPAYEEFCNFFLYPLLLMSKGHQRIVRSLLKDEQGGVHRSNFVALSHPPLTGLSLTKLREAALLTAKNILPKQLRSNLRDYLSTRTKLATSSVTIKSRIVFLEQLRQKIENIPVLESKTEWSNYYDNFFPPFSPGNEWTEKHHSVFQVLSRLKPQSVLDIGSNRGWYAQLAAHCGNQVVAFDVDEASVNKLYQDAKKNSFSILPLVMSFSQPSPEYGICGQWSEAAMTRFQCDMVFALALVHHLVFKQLLNFDQIVQGLACFSKRSLLVEFIPAEDRFVQEWWTEEYRWYTLENFLTVLRQYFCEVEILESDPSPRVLLLCSK